MSASRLHIKCHCHLRATRRVMTMSAFNSVKWEQLPLPKIPSEGRLSGDIDGSIHTEKKLFSLNSTSWLELDLHAKPCNKAGTTSWYLFTSFQAPRAEFCVYLLVNHLKTDAKLMEGVILFQAGYHAHKCNCINKHAFLLKKYM